MEFMEMIVSQILFSCDPVFINKDTDSIYLFGPFFLNDNKDVHFAYLSLFLSTYNMNIFAFNLGTMMFSGVQEHGKSLEVASRKDIMAIQ